MGRNGRSSTGACSFKQWMNSRGTRTASPTNAGASEFGWVEGCDIHVAFRWNAGAAILRAIVLRKTL